MRYLTALTLISALLTACGGKKNKDVDPKTGLSNEHYAMMKDLNESFRDLDTAVALGTGGKTTGPNEKVSKLAEMIEKAGCKEDGKANPAENFLTNWDATYAVGAGNNCPVAISKVWKYRADSLTRTWNFSHKMDIKDNDFRDESVVESFNIHKAELVLQNRSGSQKLDGAIAYSNFMSKNAGLITAGLRTSQSYNNSRGGSGTINFEISSRNGLRAKVIIGWRSGRSDTYRINGYNVDRRVIDELFSSFGLLEIKARSVNMLY